MKLLKFRIKNYKSIVDSGECYFSDRLTILAGKNESGKSSVLEALEDFQQDKTIRLEAKPIDSELEPSISITFEMNDYEINGIFENIELDITVSNDVFITLTKGLGDDSYSLNKESRQQIGIPNIYESSKKQVLDSVLKIESYIKAANSSAKFPKFINQKLIDYKGQANAFKAQNPNLTEVAEEIINIDQASDNFYINEERCKKFIEEFIKISLPNFILFSSFDDQFPKSIPIASLVKNEWAQDLEHVSNFTISKMASTNQQEQVNHEKTGSVSV